MRPHHTPHPLSSFPVYSCAFLSANKFVLGGGGGASRSGIKNKLVCISAVWDIFAQVASCRLQRLYAVNEDRAIQLKDEFELEKGEDAPMSMAAHAEVCEDSTYGSQRVVSYAKLLARNNNLWRE
jgi:prolactin regulatory element-binding protein